jgi:hypothetical protein
MKAAPSASSFTTLLPLGRKGAAFALAVRVIVSLCASLGTNYRDATAYVANPCEQGGIDYTQTGSPYGVQSPDLHGSYFPDNGSRCYFVGEWTPTHINYWHLTLNGLYWTCIVYVALLVPMHVLRTMIRRMRRTR